ncbi:cell division protein ZapA [Pseudopelagicola sp. nBUS_19]|uniref:cell division protein ZapA n=1 Tax=Pseudopelagicola sp. nBUS_19 TaxID=3395316 RepID=UPI003EC1251E
MPEVEIEIGSRVFEVACQDGEQHFLQTAAKMLDEEAKALIEQTGRIPEVRMLLMAGLMLADRTAGVEDKLRDLEARLSTQEQELTALREAPAPKPLKIEVPTIPNEIKETLAELAARAEALAAEVEEKTSS